MVSSREKSKPQCHVSHHEFHMRAPGVTATVPWLEAGFLLPELEELGLELTDS
jgi:hypothetical protein